MVYIITIVLILLVTWRIYRFIHDQERVVSKWLSAWGIEKYVHDFNQIYQDIDGFHLSKQARENADAPEYCYGEIDFVSFIAILSGCYIDSETVFYDLGSGIGKAVLACAMVFDAKKCIGIEKFELLHQAALEQADKLAQLPDYIGKAMCIEFIQQDILNTDLSDARLIFINATAFFGDLWMDISQHLTQTVGGTQIITVSKPLKSRHFKIIRVTYAAMSWGSAQVYFQIRL